MLYQNNELYVYLQHESGLLPVGTKYIVEVVLRSGSVLTSMCVICF